MLRKLFIGLLIFSALASKGAASELPDISEKLSPESLLNLCGEKWLAGAEAAAAHEIALAKAVPGFFVSALVPLGEVIRVKSLEQHICYSTGDSPACGAGEAFLSCITPILTAYNDNMISSGADISPPAL